MRNVRSGQVRVRRWPATDGRPAQWVRAWESHTEESNVTGTGQAPRPITWSVGCRQPGREAVAVTTVQGSSDEGLSCAAAGTGTAGWEMKKTAQLSCNEAQWLSCKVNRAASGL